jgi:hypothetical protein
MRLLLGSSQELVLEQDHAQETTENPIRMNTITLPNHVTSPKRPITPVPTPTPGTALIASIVTSDEKIYKSKCKV